MPTRQQLRPPPGPDALLGRLVAGLEAELPAAVALRERLHREAELSHAEHETARIVREALGEAAVQELQGAGFLARAGGAATPGVLVRAELDALPIPEETGAGFAARNGNMHACGHDVHMAALVALLRAATRLRAELPAPLVGLFQPSEEAYPSGAETIAAAPRLLGRIGAFVAAHVHPQVPWGQVAADAGAVNASCDNLEILVAGSGGHAAYPHEARDPVLALAQVVATLHQIVGRRVDPTHGATLTVSVLRAGSVENVIPGTAEAKGTLRALDDGDRALLRGAVAEAVELVARAHGCTGSVAFTEGEPAIVNDAALAGAARPALRAAGFELAEPLRSCGSDDFGYLAALGPSLLVFVGLRGAPAMADVPLHHPLFLPPPDAVAAVARAQAAAYLAAATTLSGAG